MKPLLILLFCCWELFPALSAAQPYLPKSADEVVEMLPARGKNWPEIRALRNQVEKAPNDLPTALQLIKRYIELGRSESDPRYFGYAEAALNPWLKTSRPSAEALVFGATLYQNRHDFPKALEYLVKALALQPRMPQAWLTRAAIQEVQGEYAAALSSCLPLLKLAAPLTAKVCINSTLSVSGQLDQAYQQLEQALQFPAISPTAEQQWAITTLAEMAERKGDANAAERSYQKALQLSERNGYLLATFADFLLDQHRFNEVLALLRNETRADGLLLRLTMAEQQLQLPEAEAHIQALKARFAASRLRGDTSHQGDEARFQLHVLQNALVAQELAELNWSVQREPRDARILLETAVATGKPGKVVLACLDFLAASRMQDVRLQPLVSQLKQVKS